jgi:hypothetical protein
VYVDVARSFSEHSPEYTQTTRWRERLVVIDASFLAEALAYEARLELFELALLVPLD